MQTIPPSHAQVGGTFGLTGEGPVDPAPWAVWRGDQWVRGVKPEMGAWLIVIGQCEAGTERAPFQKNGREVRPAPEIR